MARWERKEMEFLLEKVKEAEEDKMPLSALFEGLDGREELGGRKASTISQKYYEYARIQNEQRRLRIRQENHAEAERPTAIRNATPSTPKDERTFVTGEELAGLTFDWRVIEAFEGVPDFIKSVSDRLNLLEQKIEEGPKFNLDSFIHELGSVDSRLENVSEVERKNKVLEKENARLKEELRDLQGKIDRIKVEYDAANSWFDVFMNSSSIGQMMGIGEFKTSMRTTLDNWGNVLRLELITDTPAQSEKSHSSGREYAHEYNRERERAAV